MKQYPCGCSGSFKCAEAEMLWRLVNDAYWSHDNELYRKRLGEYYRHTPSQHITTSTVLKWQRSNSVYLWFHAPVVVVLQTHLIKHMACAKNAYYVGWIRLLICKGSNKKRNTKICRLMLIKFYVIRYAISLQSKLAKLDRMKELLMSFRELQVNLKTTEGLRVLEGLKKRTRD